MSDDQGDSPEILVDQTIRDMYAEESHLREDWANAVARLLASDRAPSWIRSSWALDPYLAAVPLAKLDTARNRRVLARVKLSARFVPSRCTAHVPSFLRFNVPHLP